MLLHTHGLQSRCIQPTAGDGRLERMRCLGQLAGWSARSLGYMIDTGQQHHGVETAAE